MDGTFGLSSTVKRTKDSEINFKQVLHISRKIESTFGRDDGTFGTMVAVETLFLILLPDKVQSTYEDVWEYLKELFKVYFPEETELLPGTVSLLNFTSKFCSSNVY